MHLVERLRGPERGAYRARDVVSESLQGMTFEGLVDRLDGSLYNAATKQGHFVLYNVGCLERHGKLDVIALGATEAESESLLEDEFPQVAGFD